MTLLEAVLFEARRKDVNYLETKVKGVLTKVTAQLSGIDAANVSRLMTRYKRVEETLEAIQQRRNALNAETKELANDLFDAEEVFVTRVIETAAYTITVTKFTPASEKPKKFEVDYEAAFKELLTLVPELEEKGKQILAKYKTAVEQKDSGGALKYTDNREGEKLDEGLIGMAIKSFLRSIFEWSHSYDSKLEAFRRKYGLKKIAA
jgi:hypothetical protein